MSYQPEQEPNTREEIEREIGQTTDPERRGYLFHLLATKFYVPGMGDAI